MTKELKKVNIGTSSYGMKNVIMKYEDTEEYRCCEKHKEKGYDITKCDYCYDLDYWNCSGCAGDDLNSFYGPNYSLKCDCCGAGYPQQY